MVRNGVRDLTNALYFLACLQGSDNLGEVPGIRGIFSSGAILHRMRDIFLVCVLDAKGLPWGALLPGGIRRRLVAGFRIERLLKRSDGLNYHATGDPLSLEAFLQCRLLRVQELEKEAVDGRMVGVLREEGVVFD